MTMNAKNGTNAGGDPGVLDYLRHLPAAEAPPALRARVLAALPPARRRSRRWPLALAAAATLAAAAVLLWRGTPLPPAATPVGDAMARAQALEHSLLAAPAPADPAVAAGIAAIDADLAAAYRRNAPPAEIEALWEARVRTLEAGLAARPALPARI